MIKKGLSTSVLPMGPTEDTSARLCSYTSLLPKKSNKFDYYAKILAYVKLF